MSEDTLNPKTFSGKADEYLSWKRNFQANMGIRGLSDLMKMPAPLEPRSDKEKELQLWITKKEKLYNLIILSVDNKTADVVESKAKYGDEIMA